MNLGNISSNVASIPVIQEFLKNLHFPADKQAIMNEAKSKGADNNVTSMLQKLPERQYQNQSDITNELSRIGM
jgi:hypothetical protein